MQRPWWLFHHTTTRSFFLFCPSIRRPTCDWGRTRRRVATRMIGFRFSTSDSWVLSWVGCLGIPFSFFLLCLPSHHLGIASPSYFQTFSVEYFGAGVGLPTCWPEMRGVVPGFRTFSPSRPVSSHCCLAPFFNARTLHNVRRRSLMFRGLFFPLLFGRRKYRTVVVCFFPPRPFFVYSAALRIHVPRRLYNLCAVGSVCYTLLVCTLYFSEPSPLAPFLLSYFDSVWFDGYYFLVDRVLLSLRFGYQLL
ncbi:hypothetical protein CC80DRAFT_311962 [Byssothecium circinans]|uniref:Transmembrane protein n=1 Tax=Byssothecium circinans TaxID=147558 RepID=A0A6A5U796_9PLEO|nr:hypothetical protein CC80DRAFT_311962 [Byssothecium circinans]